MTKYQPSPFTGWTTILIAFGPSTALIIAIAFAMIFIPSDSEAIFKESFHCSSSGAVSEIELMHGSAASASSLRADIAGEAVDTAM